MIGGGEGRDGWLRGRELSGGRGRGFIFGDAKLFQMSTENILDPSQKYYAWKISNAYNSKMSNSLEKTMADQS